jgi:glycine/D-amino acid oxidase-like deaminating enzyme
MRRSIVPEVEGPNKEAKPQQRLGKSLNNVIVAAPAEWRVRMRDDCSVFAPWRGTRGRGERVRVEDATFNCGAVVYAGQRDAEGWLGEHHVIVEALPIMCLLIVRKWPKWESYS